MTDLDQRLAGVVPVMATPFHADGAIDAAGFEALTEHVFGTGVTSAMMFGLASEFYKLTDAERDDLAAIFVAVAERHGAAPIVSVTEHATEVAVARARRWQELGAAAINLLPPHFLSPGAAAVTHHIDRVLAAVDIPVIVQYAPAQTGTAIAPATLARLAQTHANLTHVKVEAVPPGRYVEQVADLGLHALVGHAGVQLPDAVARGAIGVQPGCSVTEIYLHIWEAASRGDSAELRRRHAELLPHISSWMQSVEMIIQVEKTILQRRGIIGSDHCRAPAWELDGGDLALIDRLFDEFGPLLSAPSHAGAK